MFELTDPKERPMLLRLGQPKAKPIAPRKGIDMEAWAKSPGGQSWAGFSVK